MDETIQPPSILDEDLSSVDTSMPLLTKAIYDMSIDDISLVENKAKTGQNLKIKIKTTTDAVSTRGEPIRSGWPLTTYISLVPTEEYTKDSINRALARFMKAVEGKATSINPISRFKGKIVRVSVDISPAHDGFPEGNTVKSFMEVK